MHLSNGGPQPLGYMKTVYLQGQIWIGKVGASGIGLQWDFPATLRGQVLSPEPVPPGNGGTFLVITQGRFEVEGGKMNTKRP